MTVKSYALFRGKRVRIFLLAGLFLGVASFLFSSPAASAQEPEASVTSPAATEEIEANIRARSARLRIAERLGFKCSKKSEVNE